MVVPSLRTKLPDGGEVGQIDVVGHGRQAEAERELVDAASALQRVSDLPCDPVVAGAAGMQVVLEGEAGGEGVVAVVAEQLVGSRAPDQEVAAAGPVEGVVAAASVEEIVSCAPVRLLSPSVPVQFAIARPHCRRLARRPLTTHRNDAHATQRRDFSPYSVQTCKRHCGQSAACSAAGLRGPARPKCAPFAGPAGVSCAAARETSPCDATEGRPGGPRAGAIAAPASRGRADPPRPGRGAARGRPARYGAGRRLGHRHRGAHVARPEARHLLRRAARRRACARGGRRAEPPRQVPARQARPAHRAEVHPRPALHPRRELRRGGEDGGLVQPARRAAGPGARGPGARR